MDETPQRVLVVTPHPDDADFWCSGTIAKWLGDGATVRYVLCTDGGKGTTDPDISSANLSKIREQEQADAVKSLGVQELVLLHHPDGSLEDDDEFRKELVRQIRQVQPDVVLCPEPYRKNLAWHRDHRITGQVTLDAVFPCARDHLHFVELWRDEGLEPHKTATILFWGTEQADTSIDITGSMDAKIKAVAAHTSQMNGRSPSEIEEFIKERAQLSEGGSGKEFVEEFRKITFRV
ncbi:MAG: PIG-L family deacetylase [SAR202 cluster bacterium]|jgi:LmbE family N-acetylglucosaminyl deacetylase|nr:PIG-L deacetylase family protein [Dehalococcoidia bacterium]MQF88680.1 PIG-L family deacetylase [SAR202 cluster bacterium]MQG11299.1 PIG-L family deacetylase [SAR202 cluster bacterium]|tara:strand:- start:5155 stop:5859 length:705 start_codon:yes stop_codon:yes gene_type:complete